MARITLQGNPIATVGDLPAVGSRIPSFRLTKGDLSDVTQADFAGRKVVFNIVPSLDTGVCAASARRFEAEVGALDDTLVLTVSNDLPFAQARFCQAEGITHVIPLSQMRDRAFGRDWGVEIADGPLAGLLSRAVVVADGNGTVVHAQQVPEIVQEPDYAAALAAVKAIG
jgi:thiol peroxidase